MKKISKQGLKEQLWMSFRPLEIRIEKISLALKKDNKKARKIEET